MEIYITDIGILREERFFREGMKRIPKERREKIDRIKSREDRCRMLGAGLLLEYGLNRRGLTLGENFERGEQAKLGYAEHKKPYILGRRELCFNLSHSGDYAAAVFSVCEAGIDMERVREADAGMKVARRFFMQEETAFLEEKSKDTQGREFARLWTRKESYVKAIGTGMSIPMHSFSVLKERVCGEPSYHLKSWELPAGYYISVCAAEAIEAVPEETQLSLILDGTAE